jgi:hypothetical protein
LIGAVGIWVAAAGVAMAQSVENTAMDRKVRQLGLDIGKAYACTAENKREAFKEEAHHLFDLIVQDVGSDLAYTYAVNIGKGSTQPKEKLDCPAMLKKWEEIREDYELKGDK